MYVILQTLLIQEEASRKRLKRLIDTHLLKEALSIEEKNINFGKSWKL